MFGKTRYWQRCGWKLTLLGSVIVGGAIASLDYGAFAQISPDRTLRNNSTVTSQGNTRIIEGGTEAGGNLFHSFDQFSVPTGSAAYFNNALNIQNIISRVTGKSISNIDGLIRANGTANLFLLNPNGIIFGPNASLNIGGSFLASTASSLKFADGTQFSATASQTTPLLTISVPIGLQYGGTAGGILVQGGGLEVQPGKTLALVGGNVSLDGGILQAAGGRIELGAVAGTGTVGLSVDSNNLRLSFPDAVARADVSLTNAAGVYTSGEGGGDIQVNGRRVTFTDKSEMAADTLGSQNGGGISIQAEQLIVRDGAQVGAITAGEGQGGNLTVSASDLVELTGTSADGRPSALFITTYGDTDAGNLTIVTKRLVIRDGARVEAGTASNGYGGNLTVSASDSVQLSGTSANAKDLASLFAITTGNGNAGELTISTGRLIIQNGAQVSSGTFGAGQGGNLTVTAGDSVQVSGTPAADSIFPTVLSADTYSTGAAGNLTITTGRLIVRDGAVVSAGTTNKGQGGNLTVTASDSVQLSDGLLTTQTQRTGAAGNLTITTGQLIVRDGAQILTATFGNGKGGNLTAIAEDSIKLSGTSADGAFPSVLAATAYTGTGAAGNVRIETRQLIVRDGAFVSSGTFTEGQGGNLTVTASDLLELSGRSANGKFSGLSTETQGDGYAGDLTIKTRQLIVRDEAIVTSSSSGARGANAGNVLVQAESIQLDNKGELITKTSSGNGGNITLQVQDLLLLRHSTQISTSAGTAQKGGNGGNITIDAPFIVAVPWENSDITGNAFTGRGGNINITTSGIYGLEYRQQLTRFSDINASSQYGVNGTVQINTLGIDPSRGGNLPVQTVDASRQIAQNCRPGGAVASQQSSFTITGRGGLPPNPKEVLDSEAIFLDWVTLNLQGENRSRPNVSTHQTSATRAPIVEAQGWVINDQGQVVLVAHAPTVTPHSSWQKPTDCHEAKPSS